MERHQDAPLGTHVFVSISLFLLALCIAWASYKVYDVPVRAYFTPLMEDAIFYYMGEPDALPVFKRHTPL